MMSTIAPATVWTGSSTGDEPRDPARRLNVCHFRHAFAQLVGLTGRQKLLPITKMTSWTPPVISPYA
jgi:hypothetical protein